MFLKDFPPGLSLNYSVHVLALMLQSILIRAEERLETRTFSASEARAFETLLELLEAAQRAYDGALIQQKAGDRSTLDVLKTSAASDVLKDLFIRFPPENAKIARQSPSAARE